MSALSEFGKGISLEIMYKTHLNLVPGVWKWLKAFHFAHSFFSREISSGKLHQVQFSFRNFIGLGRRLVREHKKLTMITMFNVSAYLTDPRLPRL